MKPRHMLRIFSLVALIVLFLAADSRRQGQAYFAGILLAGWQLVVVGIAHKDAF